MKNQKTTAILSAIILFIAAFTACSKDKDIITVVPIDKVQLGRLMFFDKNLSNPIGQSCASCHHPGSAFTDPLHAIASQGATSGLFSNRNCPSIAYSSYTPPFHYDVTDSVFVGGFFFDGRANTLQEQAIKPFLNNLEMNNADEEMVITKLQSADYFSLFQKVYGEITNTNQAFFNIADAISSFETSPEVNRFTSKFDYYLKGKVQFNEQELNGLKLFNDPFKGNCAACHPSTSDAEIGKVLFTDFTFDNIGVPKNPANPFYTIPAAFNRKGSNALDYGLGGILNDANFYGHFKVPSLRNVALTAPYFHNGFFNTFGRSRTFL
jgi:cytochrome c peroxidase